MSGVTSMKIPADDYVAILDLYATYDHLSDDGDPVLHSHLFTEDASLTSAGRKLGGSRQEILDFRLASRATREGKMRRHYTTNVRLEPVDGSTVRGSCYMQAYDFTGANHAVLFASGTYQDTIVRKDGRWQFSSRDVNFDYQAPRTP
jgi:hypothetical protein